jgi:molybdate transport system substrate-binding protein
MLKRLLLCLALILPSVAPAETVTVAVASNALPAAEALARAFTDRTETEVRLSSGSTGALYAQIVAGAPFDVFLAADAIRPARLSGDGRAKAVATYAIGRIVLVSRAEMSLTEAAAAFEGRTVALADPLVAPYGLVAVRAMERLGLDTATFRTVIVSNVGQVASLFATGNADLAFVAASQLRDLKAPFVVSLDAVAPPVRQDAALVGDGDAARAFWDFLFSQDGAAILRAYGFGSPEQ